MLDSISACRLPALAASCGLAFLVEMAPTQAVSSPPKDALVVLGTLTCSLGGEADTANPGAQGRGVLCYFRPGLRGAEETYEGIVQGVGRAKELFERGALILAVRAHASTAIVPGLLQQSYSTEAAPAGGAPPLSGDRNRIELQPLMEEEGRVAAGKTQPDAVIITIELKLKSTPT